MMVCPWLVSGDLQSSYSDMCWDPRLVMLLLMAPSSLSLNFVA